MDAFHLAKLSKNVASVLNIERNIGTPSATLADQLHNLTSVLKKCTKVDAITDELEKLKLADDTRNAKRVNESATSASEFNSTTEDTTEDTTMDAAKVATEYTTEDKTMNTTVDTRDEDNDDAIDGDDGDIDDDVFSVEHVNHRNDDISMNVVSKAFCLPIEWSTTSS